MLLFFVSHHPALRCPPLVGKRLVIGKSMIFSDTKARGSPVAVEACSDARSWKLDAGKGMLLGKRLHPASSRKLPVSLPASTTSNQPPDSL